MHKNLERQAMLESAVSLDIVRFSDSYGLNLPASFFLEYVNKNFKTSGGFTFFESQRI